MEHINTMVESKADNRFLAVSYIKTFDRNMKYRLVF